MRYIQLKNSIKKSFIFNLSDINKIDPKFSKRRLFEWQEKGYIKKIINGYYIFTDIELNEKMFFQIANKIYKHSYISLETALHYYNLIPEQPYMILSVSTRKTKKFLTDVGHFSYKKISKKYFLGYNINNYNGVYYKIANVEKSLIDYFYFKYNIQTKDDILSLRINKEVFNEIVNMDLLYNLLNIVQNKRVEKCINNLIEVMKNA